MWRKERKEEKRRVCKKSRKYLNFYAKQSNLTHAYFSNMLMILLL